MCDGPLVEQGGGSEPQDTSTPRNCQRLRRGGYDVPDRRGVECMLRIEFLFADGTTSGFDFRYGSQSDGPPRELTKFVQHAVETTNCRRAKNFAKPE
jgi:hypothetical protein